LENKSNAFDLLRLLLAAGVITAHAYLLGGYSGEDFLSVLSKGQLHLADVSVMGFFVLSGYLITASYQRVNYIASFISHRIIRIYPGYWICILLTGVVFTTIIALLSNGNTSSFAFTDANSSLSFFYSNFFIKINQWSVGGVLNKSAYQGSLNGSLWSLYPEVQCYLLTLVLGYFGFFRKNKFVVLLLFLFCAFVFIAKDYYRVNTGPTFLYLSNALMLYASYLSGSVFFLYQDKIHSDKKLLIFALVVTILLLKFGGFQLISPLLMGYLLIYGFKSFAVKLKYDISYGLYIYGFVIQQALFAYFHNSLPFIVFLILSLALAGAMGFVSFVLVERHFIKLKKPIDRYIDALYHRHFKKKIAA
jgi:peptidoglycan/LPS O-acetylase OafA/YrhL